MPAPEQPPPPEVCCVFVPGNPNLMPGWACGGCAKKYPDAPRTYNSLRRTECKVCRHKRCDETPGTVPH